MARAEKKDNLQAVTNPLSLAVGMAAPSAISILADCLDKIII
jgi:hypothetical protein